MSFSKDLLGVQRQTTNIGVLMELGQTPLTLHARKNSIKNWERITLHKKANDLIKNSCEWNLQNEQGWIQSVKEYLSSIGLMEIFLNRDVKRTGYIKVFNREKDIFIQSSFFEIQKESSKLRTYSKLKKTFGLEDYLTKIQNINDRVAMTKLRLSNHHLMIEKGRYTNIDRKNRVCPFLP